MAPNLESRKTGGGPYSRIWQVWQVSLARATVTFAWRRSVDLVDTGCPQTESLEETQPEMFTTWLMQNAGHMLRLLSSLGRRRLNRQLGAGGGAWHTEPCGVLVSIGLRGFLFGVLWVDPLSGIQNGSLAFLLAGHTGSFDPWA